MSAYRREINALQKSNQTMAATVQRHEHNIHTMVQDLRKANEKLALEQVREKKNIGDIILSLNVRLYWTLDAILFTSAITIDHIGVFEHLI